MTSRYAVIGNPVAHSLSPLIHQDFAKQFGIDLCYEKRLSELDDFASSVLDFFKKGGQGLNVTVPFKIQAYALANVCNQRSQIAGSVNTLGLTDDKRIWADNTDGIGLVTDIKVNLSYQLSGKRILVLGAGGAAQGILPALLKEQPKQILIANRSVDKAQALAVKFSALGELCAFSLQAIKNKPVDVIINATSVALSEQALVLPKKLPECALCYELAYSNQSAFMTWANENGAQQVSDGLGMLVEQAAASFFAWHALKPKTQLIYETLRHRLKN